MSTHVMLAGGAESACGRLAAGINGKDQRRGTLRHFDCAKCRKALIARPQAFLGILAELKARGEDVHGLELLDLRPPSRGRRRVLPAAEPWDFSRARPSPTPAGDGRTGETVGGERETKGSVRETGPANPCTEPSCKLLHAAAELVGLADRRAKVTSAVAAVLDEHAGLMERLSDVERPTPPRESSAELEPPGELEEPSSAVASYRTGLCPSCGRNVQVNGYGRTHTHERTRSGRLCGGGLVRTERIA